MESSTVTMDPIKVTSVVKWPILHNVKGVRGFLGFTGYYRKFTYGYLAKPLTELIENDGFHLGTNPLSVLLDVYEI